MEKMDELTPVSQGNTRNIVGKRFRFYTPAAIILMLALALLMWLMHFAPFYAPSYFFWIGFILALIGLISLIRPLRFLLVFNRKIATAIICFGLLLSATVLQWPVPLLHSQVSRQSIDTLMPDYSFREYHEVRVKASPEQVIRAMHQVSISDIPTVCFLLRLRDLVVGKRGDTYHSRQRRPIPKSQLTHNNNFLVSNTNEFVTVLILKSWASADPPAVTTAEQFMFFKDPGYVKVASNFQVRSLGHGQTILSTETRIHANDTSARRSFSRYWRIIYPGSAITRRVWLDTIAARAEMP